MTDAVQEKLTGAEQVDNVPEVMTGKELDVNRKRNFSDAQLREITSFDDLVAMVNRREDLSFVDVSDFGNGFSILDTKDKSRLIGREFYILDWRFNKGDKGEFVSMNILTRDNQKLVINDGSTGICQQMRDIETANGGTTALVKVPRGLRVSEYTYENPDTGKDETARTYYLDYSK